MEGGGKVGNCGSGSGLSLESSLPLPSGPHHSPAPREEGKREMRKEDLIMPFINYTYSAPQTQILDCCTTCMYAPHLL